MNITNGFIADLYMTMIYNNIFNYEEDGEGNITLTDSLIIPMTIKPGSTLDKKIDVSEKILAYGSNSEEPIKSIMIGYDINIKSGVLCAWEGWPGAYNTQCINIINHRNIILNHRN